MEEQKSRKRNADGELKVKVKEEKRLKLGDFNPAWRKIQYITLPGLLERKGLKLYYDVTGNIKFPLDEAINILLNGKIQQPSYLVRFFKRHFKNRNDFEVLQGAIINKFINDNGIDPEKEPDRLKNLWFNFSVAGLALKFYGEVVFDKSFGLIEYLCKHLSDSHELPEDEIPDRPPLVFTSFYALVKTTRLSGRAIWNKIKDNTFDHAEVTRFGLGFDSDSFLDAGYIFDEVSGCDKTVIRTLKINFNECGKVFFLFALDEALSRANYSLILSFSVCRERSTWSTLISHGVTVEYFYTAVVRPRRYNTKDTTFNDIPYIVFDNSYLILQFAELYDHHWKVAFIYMSKLVSNYHKECSTTKETPLPPVNFDTIYHGIFRLFELDFRILKVIKQRYQ